MGKIGEFLRPFLDSMPSMFFVFALQSGGVVSKLCTSNFLIGPSGTSLTWSFEPASEIYNFCSLSPEKSMALSSILCKSACTETLLGCFRSQTHMWFTLRQTFAFRYRQCLCAWQPLCLRLDTSDGHQKALILRTVLTEQNNLL